MRLPSFFSDTIVSPSFFFKAPANVPRTVCALCRCRHNPHYADARIMPIDVGNPASCMAITPTESA